MSEPLNCYYDWDAFDARKYHEQYTEGIILEDRYMTPATIMGIFACMQANGIVAQSLERGIDVCNGGSPIAPGLIAPLITSNKEALEWSDIGRQQLESAQQNILAGRNRNLAGWEAHQDYMARTNPLWRDAMYRAADIGVAVKRNALELEEDAYDIGSCNFGFDSLTKSKKEWKTGVLGYLSSIRVGGIATMQYMIGTNGYGSAGQYYPGVPIYPDDVLAIAEQRLTQIQSYAFYVPAQPNVPHHRANSITQKAVRPEGDPTSYKGMGVLVGIRK